MGFGFAFENLSVGKARLPGLVFSFRVDNPHPRISRVWSYYFELWLANDISASDTVYLGQLSANMVSGVEWLAEYHQSQQRHCELVWHFEAKQIQTIEDSRRGGDVFFEIRGSLLVASDYAGTASRQEVAWDLPYMNNTYPLRLKVAQSDWVKLLNELKFTHILFYEFPVPEFPPAFARAVGHLKEAWDHHRKGESDGALGSCFKAFECLGYDLLRRDSIKRRELIESLLSHESQTKRETFLACVESVQNFMHLGRHARSEPSRVHYEDAEMVLLCATALLGYLAKQYARTPLS